MRNFFAGLSVAVLLAGGGPAVAQSNQVLVELYTSQGCSSCPPADELLGRLASRDDVIPLALHVDYWDYIGWKDIFADPAYADRQRLYARAAGSRTIYTPQMIIGGTEDVVGNRVMDVMDAINALKVKDYGVRLTLERDGDRLEISARMQGRKTPKMVVQLVRYEPLQSVTITRGENAGKTIDYYNTVTEWRQIGKWDGKAPLQLVEAISGDQPVVVILQAVGPGKVLATARLR